MYIRTIHNPISRIDRVCPICGQPFKVTPGVRGRPRDYDTAACRELAAALNIVDRFLGSVSTRIADVDHAAKLKKRLWQLANIPGQHVLTARSVERGAAKRKAVRDATDVARSNSRKRR